LDKVANSRLRFRGSFYIISGGVTFLWGGVLLMFFPKEIMFAERLTTEEKAMLLGRSLLNQTVSY
jgi:hypothetical protein